MSDIIHTTVLIIIKGKGGWGGAAEQGKKHDGKVAVKALRTQRGGSGGSTKCVMYNKWPLAESWPSSSSHYNPSVSASPLFPLRPWNTPLLPLPSLPLHSCFNHHSLLHPQLSFSFLSVFLLYTPFHSFVRCTFELMSTCVLAFNTSVGHCHFICMYPALSLATTRNWASVCVSPGIIFFLLIWQNNQEMHVKWSSASYWYDLFSSSDKGYYKTGFLLVLEAP